MVISSIVSYDRYSLIINNERIYIWSGEFHPFRLPSPSLWIDILEKMKSAGFNAVSVYVNWGYHTSKSGIYDYTGIRDWDLFLKFATKVGIYVIFRPGPYINAETTGGGFPGWLGSNVKSKARSHAADYGKEWTEYLTGLNKIVIHHQVFRKSDGGVGGCVILYQLDNEFATCLDPEYMLQLREQVVVDGIIVPLIHNDASNAGNWARGKGAVDIYSFDSYPNIFDAKDPKAWLNDPEHPKSAFYNRQQFDSPMFIAEFQGGAMDMWKGNTYEKCRQFTDYDF
ncbi:hypothetical protein HK096_010059, partial [Nowakowskiella sp. JEL0078]